MGVRNSRITLDYRKPRYNAELCSPPFKFPERTRSCRETVDGTVSEIRYRVGIIVTQSSAQNSFSLIKFSMSEKRVIQMRQQDAFSPPSFIVGEISRYACVAPQCVLYICMLNIAARLASFSRDAN